MFDVLVLSCNNALDRSPHFVCEIMTHKPSSTKYIPKVTSQFFSTCSVTVSQAYSQVAGLKKLPILALFCNRLGNLSPQPSSVQFNLWVVSNSLWPHGLQHTNFPVHHQHLKLAQTHVHQVYDAIQPSHPLSSPSLPAFNLSQHQGLFQWVSSLYQVAKVLEFQLQHQSFQWIFRTDFL